MCRVHPAKGRGGGVGQGGGVGRGGGEGRKKGNIMDWSELGQTFSRTHEGVEVHSPNSPQLAAITWQRS